MCVCVHMHNYAHVHVCACVCVHVVKAQLLEQEEREKEVRRRMSQKGSSRFGGQISTFSLGGGLSGPKILSPSITSPHSVSATLELHVRGSM